MRIFSRIFIYFCFIIFLIPNNLNASSNFCEEAIQTVEKKYNIPYKLLSAISLTETGRTIDGNFVSWPWSFNVSGKTVLFENEDNARKFLKEKIKKNLNNIDIGCMQINYKYHNKRFKNLDDILNPLSNVDWAAKYLKSLFSKYKSWNTAISRYHSSNPKRMKNYLKKVHKNWNIERQKRKVSVFINKKNIKKDNISHLDFKSFYYKENKDKIDFFRQDFIKNRSI